MPKIKFIEHIERSGHEQVVDAEIGRSVMQAAVDNRVPGIIADCGGAGSCATCHGYIDPAWFGRVPPADDNELSMLECVIDGADNSRLTCQIKMTAELDNLVVRLPKSQI